MKSAQTIQRIEQMIMWNKDNIEDERAQTAIHDILMDMWDLAIEMHHGVSDEDMTIFEKAKEAIDAE